VYFNKYRARNANARKFANNTVHTQAYRGALPSVQLSGPTHFTIEIHHKMKTIPLLHKSKIHNKITTQAYCGALPSVQLGGPTNYNY
jgi:hypothetical protein